MNEELKPESKQLSEKIQSINETLLIVGLIISFILASGFAAIATEIFGQIAMMILALTLLALLVLVTNIIYKRDHPNS